MRGSFAQLGKIDPSAAPVTTWSIPSDRKNDLRASKRAWVTNRTDCPR